VTCPAGQTVAITAGGRAVFDWRCCRCRLRERCTRAKDGKTVNLHPYEAELAAACRQAATPAYLASYRRWRPMVERSIAWLVANGHRRVRYRGLARNQLGLSLRVAAVNLRRLIVLGLFRADAGWVLA
jgi:Transposase DDE domain